MPDVDHVFVTNVGMHGLNILFRGLSDEGDEVILPYLMWMEISQKNRLAGGKPVPVHLRPEDGCRYDLDAMEAAITSSKRAIFVNTPHNPTGAVNSRDTLEQIAALAGKLNYCLSAMRLMSMYS